MMILKPLLVAVVTLTTASLPLIPAAASPLPEAPSITVRTSDLDLTSDRGAKRLRTRVLYAAQLVCGDADPRDLSAMRPIKACRSAAIANATPKVEVAIAAARGGDAYAANDVHLSALRH